MSKRRNTSSSEGDLLTLKLCLKNLAYEPVTELDGLGPLVTDCGMHLTRVLWLTPPLM
jgi:hypothetical protein